MGRTPGSDCFHSRSAIDILQSQISNLKSRISNLKSQIWTPSPTDRRQTAAVRCSLRIAYRLLTAYATERLASDRDGRFPRSSGAFATAKRERRRESRMVHVKPRRRARQDAVKFLWVIQWQVRESSLAKQTNFDVKRREATYWRRYCLKWRRGCVQGGTTEHRRAPECLQLTTFTW